MTESTPRKFSASDHEYMLRAIKLAQKAHYTTSPNPRVGCVLVNNGEVVGEGYHIKAGEPHAEVNAIKMAGDKANGATAYVTLEPCSHFGRTPPCAKGLIEAKVAHVVVAMVDPNPKVSGNGLRLLEEAGISTQVGLLEADARELNPGFIKLMTNGLPFVRCKLASSLDGKTAMANGESQWITSSHAREDVQRLRAQSCAVISGADSVTIDDAKMNVRWESLGYIKSTYEKKQVRQPVRVIIDSQNRLKPNLNLFTIESPIIIVTSTIENLHTWPHFVEHVKCQTKLSADGKEKIDLLQLLKILAKRGLNDVLVESGARLAGAFIEQNLVDELILYQAPKLMAAEAKSLIEMPTIEHLNEAKLLNIKEVTMVGEDIRITANFVANRE